MKKINTLFLFFLIALVSCDNNTFVLPEPVNQGTANIEKSRIYNKSKPDEERTIVTKDTEYTMVIQLNSNVKGKTHLKLESKENLNAVIAKYTAFQGLLKGEFKLLPAENYQFNINPIDSGKNASESTLKIVNFKKLFPGNYILPLLVKANGDELLHLVTVFKDSEFTPLLDKNPKPLPPNFNVVGNRTSPMKMVAYVETNDWDIRNMGEFLLKDSKKPLFDIVILFASNMNYDAITGKRYLAFNDKLQPLVNNPDIYIKPLHDRGIKVLACILPNHQGVGFENFQSYEDALSFAKNCKSWADKLGLDGFDIDEEYADYGKQPSLQVKGTQSYFWFMRAMKEVMPNKLLTLYDYGHDVNAAYVDSKNKKAKDYLDYSWANYREHHPSRAGIPNERYGEISYEANYGLNSLALEYIANENLKEGFGLYMIFNINGYEIKEGEAGKNLSGISKPFYGEDCVWTGVYHNGPKDTE